MHPDQDGPTSSSARTGLGDRRGFLRGAGLASAGVLGGVSVPARAETERSRRGPRPSGDLVWLAGDHHLHSQYSNDAMFRIEDQARRAVAGGLDWIVITDQIGRAHV